METQGLMEEEIKGQRKKKDRNENMTWLDFQRESPSVREWLHEVLTAWVTELRPLAPHILFSLSKGCVNFVLLWDILSTI